MEASSRSTVVSLISSSPSSQNHCCSSSTSKRQPPQFISFSPLPFSKCRRFPNSQNPPSLFSACPPPNSLHLQQLHQRNSSGGASALSASVGHQILENSTDHLPPPSSSQRDILPKIDKRGRLCSPRAARELALLIIYAACLEGSDPVRLFEKRLNSRREPGYKFDKESLMEYNHMSFGGPPVTVDTIEEADELSRSDDKESEIEAEVLSAPPKLVYSKLILRFTRKLLVAVVEKWDSHVLVIDKVAPDNWKNAPASRILELSILHLAMSEIAILHTRHQIVINEAVDLAKRFCDGASPRIINGCLRTFVRDLGGTSVDQGLKS